MDFRKTPMKFNLSQIRGAFHLPRPNWDVIRGWLEKQIPEVEREQAWEDAVRQWLETLNQALGDAYQTLSSGRLLVFAHYAEHRSPKRLAARIG